MKKIIWNIDNVKINVPDIYMEEYPEGGKTFKVGFDSKDIAENTGIVQFTFAVGYNGGVILCSDYAVGSDGSISFDLPVGVHVEISGNEATATKVSSGGGSQAEPLADIVVRIAVSYDSEEEDYVVSSYNMTPSEVINAMYDEESGRFTKTSLAVIQMYQREDEPILTSVANFVDFTHGLDQNIIGIQYQAILFPTGQSSSLYVYTHEISADVSVSDTWEYHVYEYEVMTYDD